MAKGPHCTVCGHPRRREVEEAFRGGASTRAIAAQFEPLSRGAIERHLRKHMTPRLAEIEETSRRVRSEIVLKAVEEQAREEVALDLDFWAQLRSQLAGLLRLYDDCAAQLADPRDSRRLFLGPRADEIEVMYLAGESRGVATLAELLERVQKGGVLDVVRTSVRVEDPRRLMLRILNALDRLLGRMPRPVAELPAGEDVDWSRYSYEQLVEIRRTGRLPGAG